MIGPDYVPPRRHTAPSGMDGTGSVPPLQTGHRRDTSKNADTVAKEIPVSAQGDAAAVRRLLQKYAEETPDEALRALARQVGLTNPDEIEGYVLALKQTTVLTDPTGERLRDLTPQEETALEGREDKVKLSQEDAPKDAKFWAQARNQLRSAAAATSLGFGLITLITKTAAYASMPTPFFLLNLGGAIVLFGGEIVAGQIRGRGPDMPPSTPKHMADSTPASRPWGLWRSKRAGSIPTTPRQPKGWTRSSNCAATNSSRCRRSASI